MDANPVTLDLPTAQAGYRANAEARREAREDLRKAMEDRAQNRRDAAYKMSTSFALHRSQSKPVEQCKIDAKSDAAPFEFEADMADARVKAAQARLAELEGERATLRQLVEWSLAVDRGA